MGRFRSYGGAVANGWGRGVARPRCDGEGRTDAPPGYAFGNRPTGDGAWVRVLMERKPTKVVAFTLVNKTAASCGR
jgi:hypothetical protein